MATMRPGRTVQTQDTGTSRSPSSNLLAPTSRPHQHWRAVILEGSGKGRRLR